MEEEVKLAIFKRLAEEYDDIPLYDERIKQGMKEPAFFVLSIDGTQKPGIDRRRIRTLLFDIHYFPPANSAKREACEQIAARLYELLAYVDHEDDLIRGSDMHHQVIDEVLHFFISFNVHLLKAKQDETKIQKLDQEVRLK